MPHDVPGYLDRYGRMWRGPFPYTLDEMRFHRTLMKTSGVYQVLFVHPGGTYSPAYVGRAIKGTTIYDRLTQHVRNSSNWALARITDHTKFRFVFFPCDGDSACQIESHITCDAKPPFNAQQEWKNYVPNITVQ